MRTSIVFLLAIVGMTVCQTSPVKPIRGNIKACISDIENGKAQIVKAAEEIQVHEYLQAIYHIGQLVEDIENGRDDCLDITVDQIIVYIIDNLPAPVQNCMKAAAQFYIECREIDEDIKKKDYIRAIQQIKPLYEDAKAVCANCN